MRANPLFRQVDKRFWANVRSISQTLGYTNRKTQQIRTYTTDEIKLALSKIDLQSHHIETDGKVTEFGEMLVAYFEYRARVLNEYVEPRLMNVARASNTFYRLQQELSSNLAVPIAMIPRRHSINHLPSDSGEDMKPFRRSAFPPLEK